MFEYSNKDNRWVVDIDQFTLPCHGINIGADVTKLWLAWLIRNKNKNNIDKDNSNFFEFFFLWFLELSGLKIDIDLH